MSFTKETFQIENFFSQQLRFLNQTLFFERFLVQVFIPRHGLWHTLLFTVYDGEALSETHLVLVCATCFCLLSVTLFFFPFVDWEMSASAVRLCGPDVVSELSAKLVRRSGASNLLHPRVGHLLAHWSVSSPQCRGDEGSPPSKVATKWCVPPTRPRFGRAPRV